MQFIKKGVNFVKQGMNEFQREQKEKILKSKINKLLQTNFSSCDRDNTISLIKEIKNNLLKLDSLEINGAKLEVENNLDLNMSKNTAKGFKTYKSLREKYNNWRIGDPEEIYSALEAVASKNENGKLSTENLEELKGNTIVWDFLCVIIHYLGMQVGLVDEKQYQQSNIRLIAGELVKQSLDIPGINF